MIGLTVKLEGDGAWPDLRTKNFIHVANGAPPIEVAVLDGGLASGRPSVAIRIELPDGQTVVAETTARLFVTAGRAIAAKYPRLFEDDA